MSYTYKGTFENTIGSTGYDNNFGFDGPYSNAYSLNSRDGRLTGGILPNVYTPDIEGPSTISDIHASYDRMFYNTNNYDSIYNLGMETKPGKSSTPVADANAELESLPPVVKNDLPPPSDAPEPEELTSDEQSVITQQPQENNDGTVSVAVEENPPETIKEQESFIYGGRLRRNGIGKFTPNSNGVYTAQSKRVQPAREKFTTEINGLRDSQYLNETFLDTRPEQEQSNAIALVILTICFFFITLAIVWTTFGDGCCECNTNQKSISQIPQTQYKPAATYKPPQPVQQAQPTQQTEGFGFSGGNKKLTGSIF